MAARSENEFPTLRDFRDRLSELIDKGLGDLPAQILVVPDSTMQVIACHFDPTRTLGVAPALMIDLDRSGGRMPVCLISTDRMVISDLPSRRVQ
jgi:hypothetical protein